MRPRSSTARRTMSRQWAGSETSPETVTALSAGLAHPLGRVLGVFVLGQVTDQDFSALPRVRDGDGAADPAVATGDDGDLAGQLAGADVGMLAAVRHRLHAGLGARDLLLLGGLAHVLLLVCDQVGVVPAGGCAYACPPARRPRRPWAPSGQFTGRRPRAWRGS